MNDTKNPNTQTQTVSIVAVADMAMARRELSILSVNLLLEGLRNGDPGMVGMALRSLGVEDDSLMFSKVCTMINALEDTMDEFRKDLGVNQASNAAPSINDAAYRLESVINQTFDAVNITLDISEAQLDIFQNQLEAVRSIRSDFTNPALSAAERDALLFKALDTMENQIVSCQEMNLKILVTQSFQDLTGQVIKKVITLVQRIEDQLANLSAAFGRDVLKAPDAPKETKIYGSPISQQQADEFLSNE